MPAPMERVTIVRGDNRVYVNGEAMVVDTSTLAADVHVVQWLGDRMTPYGEIEFFPAADGPREPNQRFTDFTPYQPFYDEWVRQRQLMQQQMPGPEYDWGPSLVETVGR